MVKSKAGAPRAQVRILKNEGDADQALREIAEAQRQMNAIETDYEAQIAKLREEAAEKLRPHVAQVNSLVDSLFIFANSNRDALVERGTKTIELPAGVVQWRMTPPAVSFKKGVKIKKIVALLKAAGFKHFIRLKEEPNKEVMLAYPEVATKIPEIRIGQVEQFAVKPATGLKEIVLDAAKLLKRLVP